mmetsp:Transcript_5257/g.6136  ORF Transcript_5257/g.6136 Transcript_5257/m.6136 type:complete len:111 (+) Transcript_5257:210-542(+)
MVSGMGLSCRLLFRTSVGDGFHFRVSSRIVPEARTKFNLPLHKANRLMRGGRKCGDWIVHHSNIDRTSANLVAMPLYQENGLPQESFRSFDDDNLCAAGVPERYKEIVYG